MFALICQHEEYIEQVQQSLTYLFIAYFFETSIQKVIQLIEILFCKSCVPNNLELNKDLDLYYNNPRLCENNI